MDIFSGVYEGFPINAIMRILTLLGVSAAVISALIGGTEKLLEWCGVPQQIQKWYDGEAQSGESGSSILIAGIGAALLGSMPDKSMLKRVTDLCRSFNTIAPSIAKRRM